MRFNKQDFDQHKMLKNAPLASIPESGNSEYTKTAKQADESSKLAENSKTHETHKIAADQHSLAFGLAGVQHNKDYHRSSKFSHEEQSDKLYRKEQNKMRHATRKEKR